MFVNQLPLVDFCNLIVLYRSIGSTYCVTMLLQEVIYDIRYVANLKTCFALEHAPTTVKV